jgi:hypothetical protein
MKPFILTVSTIFLLAISAAAQERTTTTATGPSSASKKTSTTTTTEVDAAVDLYKERAAEGARPTLTIKNGEAKISEPVPVTTRMYPGELAPGNPTGFAPGEIPSTQPTPQLYAKQIAALKDQVETLKKLNAALEEELATCKNTKP